MLAGRAQREACSWRDVGVLLSLEARQGVCVWPRGHSGEAQCVAPASHQGSLGVAGTRGTPVLHTDLLLFEYLMSVLLSC